jgi:hypothetical protein
MIKTWIHDQACISVSGVPLGFHDLHLDFFFRRCWRVMMVHTGMIGSSRSDWFT